MILALQQEFEPRGLKDKPDLFFLGHTNGLQETKHMLGLCHSAMPPGRKYQNMPRFDFADATMAATTKKMVQCHGGQVESCYMQLHGKAATMKCQSTWLLLQKYISNAICHLGLWQGQAHL